VAPAKRPGQWERVDTVFPEPHERNGRHQKEKWSVRPFLESTKVPVPITELAKVKPFSIDIKKVLFPEEDTSSEDSSGEEPEEDDPIMAPRTQKSGKQQSKQIPISTESDEEDEEDDESPRPPGRRSTQKTSAFTDLLRIRQMSEEEFDRFNANQKKQISPAIKVGAFLGEYFFQEILVDIGADCNLIDLHTAKKIIGSTKDCALRTDRNEITITGVAGRTNISGYLIVPVDLGHGVVCQDVIYIVDNIFGSNSKMFLGKPFLAIIDATIGVRYDYLAVPLSDGAPIHISGRKYLGNGIWEEVQFPKSTQAVLSKSRIVKACKEYAVEQDGNSVTHLEDNLGNYCHPWAGIIYSCTTGISQKGVEPSLPPESHDPLTASSIEQQLLQVKHGGWTGMETISMAHFGRHVAALLCPQSPTAFSVEGGVSMGRGDLSTGLFTGYTSETAVEEGLTEFVVDDITWWACLEGMSMAQKNRLRDILRKNRSYVATSVHEMRHCSPGTIAHDLIPKDNAV